MVSQSNYKLRRLLFQIFLSLCFAGSALAQIQATGPGSADSGLGGNNSIIGTVLSPSGQRMERRIRVKLSTMTRGDVTSMTDEMGNFAFRRVVDGNYTVVIDGEKEYEPVVQDVRIIQLRGSPPQTYMVNIRLALKGNSDLKPGVINSAFANVPKRALDFYNKAVDLAKAGDSKGAIEQFGLATSEYPKFMLAFNELGVIYLRLNDLEKADESFQTALKIEPEAFAPLLNRCILFVQMKRYAEAEPMLRSVLNIKEDSVVGHYFLGQALANLGRFDAAEKELVYSITNGGDEMVEAHRVLAIIYSAKGEKIRAAGELETYLRLAPKTPDAVQLRQVILQLKASGAPTPLSPPNVKPSV
ncbi:MAG: tetratricopeptide repeat protein [Pyrinomonadaceae bacterium]